MNKQEIIKGNKMIAEFMGAILYPKWTSSVYKEPYPTFDFEDNHPTKDYEDNSNNRLLPPAHSQ